MTVLNQDLLFSKPATLIIKILSPGSNRGCQQGDQGNKASATGTGVEEQLQPPWVPVPGGGLRHRTVLAA